MSKCQIFRANTIITCNDNRDVFTDGFLAIENEKIVDIGPWKKRPRAKSLKVQDVSFGLIMPGLFNMHTHLPMTLLRGIAEDVELQSWFFETIIPIEKEWVSENFVRIGTELGILESIRSGVTFLSDMYYYEMDVAKAMDRMGVRGFAGHHIWDWKAPDCATKDAAFEQALLLAKKFKNHPRVIPGIAPHAPYSCSPDTFRESAEFAKLHNLSVMVHVAETEGEQKSIKEKYGRNPFELLKDSGLLEVKNLLIAHAVWPEKSDFKFISKPNISVVLNAQCNAKLASGIPPIEDFRKNKVRIVLGTDGPASNNTLDIFSEINFISKIHHVSQRNLTGFPAMDIIESATIRAAESIGLGHECGSLEIGKDADFIIVDLHSPHLFPKTNIVNHVVHAMRGQDVDSTYVKGRPLMKNKKILYADSDKILKNAESLWKKIQRSIPKTSDKK